MKIITFEQIERLEKISSAIEHAKKTKTKSKLIDDIEWLLSELRKAYMLIEDQATK